MRILKHCCISLLIFGLMMTLPTTRLFAEEASSKPERDSPLKTIFDRQDAKVEVVADTIEYSRDQKKVIAKGNVVLRYQNTQITSDYAEVETDSRKAYARGHVLIFQEEIPTARGEEITYDFANKTGSFPDGRGINPPWYSTGKEIDQIKEGVKVIRSGTVTTCDYEKPHYDFSAKKVTIYEGDKIVAKNVTMHVLGKPVFWLPYVILPLNSTNAPFTASAGYNSKFGAYIFLSKGFSITKQIWGKVHADWRSKRGFGGGLDFGYDFQKFGQGLIRTYWTQDKEAPVVRAPAGAFSEQQNRDRGRINWLHRTDFDPDTFFMLRYNRIADEFFLQDFFEKEFRSEVEPQSFLTFTKNTDDLGVFVHLQKRMNSFESMVERLPQVRFDSKNQQFMVPWLYYENQESFDHMTKRFGRSEMREGVTRADSFHEWSVPLKWNEIKFRPLANFRGTYYSRERESDNDHFRVVAGYGADLRTQFYKTYQKSFEKFGIEINQLRHVIEPSVRYESFMSTVSDEKLNEFDGIDRIDDADIITFGLENRIQTKRVINGKMRRVDIVSLNTFLSYEFHPDGKSRATSFAPSRDGHTGSNFTILTQEIVLRPYEWLKYEVRTDFDLKDREFRVLNQDLVVDYKRVSVLFGHRFIRDIIDIEGSNQFVFDGKYTLNPLWAIGGYIRWDSERNELQEWQIGATRDLHDFILDFGYNVRESQLDAHNQELYFRFRMKAFPEQTLRGGQIASFSRPRIGETVAGANLSSYTSYQSTYQFYDRY